jgi:cobalt/nickel transport system permease protein
MHISEGVLSAPILVTGAALTVAGLYIGLKKMDYDRLPQVALLASAFFVASLIHVPIGPASVHLVLNGVIGLLLGWSAFPAIFVGLTLQALLFQFGGITTLGVNTFNMAMPAVLCFYLFNHLSRRETRWLALTASFSCGFLAIFLSAVLVAVSLVSTGEEFFTVGWTVAAAHIPVMLIEGGLTVFLVGFLRKVKPEILEVPNAKRLLQQEIDLPRP